ncbi:MAG: hypothetical protein AAFQ82_17380, partial [Myxococcota bacterium]
GLLSVPLTSEGSVSLFFPRNSSVVVNLKLAPGPKGARLDGFTLELNSGEPGREVQLRNFSALLRRFRRLAGLVSNTTDTTIKRIEIDGRGRVSLEGSHTPPSPLPFSSPRPIPLSRLNPLLPRVPVDLVTLAGDAPLGALPDWIAEPEFDLQRVIRAMAGKTGTFELSLEGSSGDTSVHLDGSSFHAHNVPVELKGSGEFGFKNGGVTSTFHGDANLGAFAGATAALRAQLGTDQMRLGGTMAVRAQAVPFGTVEKRPESGDVHLTIDQETMSGAIEVVMKELEATRGEARATWWVRALLAAARLFGSEPPTDEIDGTLSGKAKTTLDLRNVPGDRFDLEGPITVRGAGRVAATTGSGRFDPVVNSDVELNGTVELERGRGEFQADDVKVNSTGEVRVGPRRFDVAVRKQIDVDNDGVSFDSADFEIR